MQRFKQQFWLICVILIGVTSPILSQEIIVNTKNSQESDTLRSTFINNNIRYISLYEFADLFNARTFFSENTKKMILYLENKVIKVTAFNPFIIVDDQVFQLTAETYLQNNEVFVPLNDFINIIKQLFPNNITYNDVDGRLEITRSSYANVNAINIQEKANGTLIRISTSRSFTKSEVGFRERHGWLYVDIYGGRLDSVSLSQKFDTGIVSEIIPIRTSEQTVQLSFKLRKSIVDKQIFFDNPNEILVSLKTKADVSPELSQELEKEKKKWLIDKIVIDPGHGGKDPGAIGPNGLFEKDVILGIALELAQIIRKRSDIEVIMTRDDDRFVNLRQRTELANKNEAKLFISIHANSNPSRRTKGVTTYFLGTDNTDEAREVALFENAVIKYESGSKYADLTNENIILSAMAQNVYNTESQDLAAMIQDEISDRCVLTDRGVKQAGFLVLWGASMPNVLVETAFISNAEEERKLKTRAFQKKMAESIFEGIMKFKKKYEWGI
jgi:N-acetylmuramoyl-L-alanine amidase